MTGSILRLRWWGKDGSGTGKEELEHLRSVAEIEPQGGSPVDGEGSLNHWKWALIPLPQFLAV